VSTAQSLEKSLRIQYLKAMDIQLWVRRNPSESSPPQIAQQLKPQKPLAALTTAVAMSPDLPVNPSLVESANTQRRNPSESSPPQIAQQLKPQEPLVALTTAVAMSKDLPVNPSLVESANTQVVEAKMTTTTATSHQSFPDLSQTVLPTPISSLDWEALQTRVAACQACGLHQTRTQTVLGVGNRQADWMFIGEAPGAEEDAQGIPFVGKAGQLLTNMLYAIKLKREEIYITNVIKCRPPDNRNPHQEEMIHCQAFLQRQIALIQPKLIIAVGKIAAQHLLTVDTPISKLRGQRFEYGENKLPLLATYHPAYLLRRPTEKRQSWQDFQFIHQMMAELKKS
jgi:DNA polymerase